MDVWQALLGVLVLLVAAMVLGAIFERLRQSPLLGYLLAGTLLGPNALNQVPSYEIVTTIAELGVAMLLFTIGLEFSWRRLKAVGQVALGGGTFQIVGTTAIGAVIAHAAGLDWRASLAIGAMLAVSSTAAVMRLLANRAEIEAVHGRNAVGILLLQDIAVVPLLLMVSSLTGQTSLGQFVTTLGRALVVAAILIGALYVALTHVMPRILGARATARNRDLPILLAIATAVGAALLSHELGLSPVLGAFVAGMLLAESPFATQIRADVVPLQTLFVTLFFSSIGMLSDPRWIVANGPLVIAVVTAIVIGKAAITSACVRMFGSPTAHSIATGMVLAQVGEFALVIATVASDGNLIGSDVFNLILTSLTITLVLSPYLIAAAPKAAGFINRTTKHSDRWTEEHRVQDHTASHGHVVIVGFGPAGQRVAEALLEGQCGPMIVVDLAISNLEHAESYGIGTLLGDATRDEILERLYVRTASAVVVTVPDPATARLTVEHVRAHAPDTPVFVRSRYHVHRWQLDVAGSYCVIDEEHEVGVRLAAEVKRRLIEVGVLGSPPRRPQAPDLEEEAPPV